MTVSNSRRLILHMGLHKTASSSLQSTLQGAEDEFSQAGMHILRVETPKGLRQVNHSTAMQYAFSSTYETLSWGPQRGFTAHDLHTHYSKLIAAQLEGSHDLLISGEEIAGLTQKELTKLRGVLEEAGFTIEPHLYVRSPASLIASLTQERLKAGLPLTLSVPDFSSRIERVRSVFPDVRIHSFEQACRHPSGPVGHFLEISGLSKLASPAIKRRNESLSAPTARLLARMNGALRIGHVLPNGAQRSVHDTKILWKLPGPAFTLNANEYDKLAHAIAAETDALVFQLSKCTHADKEVASVIRKAKHTTPSVKAGNAAQNLDPELSVENWGKGLATIFHKLEPITAVLARASIPAEIEDDGDIRNQLDTILSKPQFSDALETLAPLLRDRALECETKNRTEAITLMRTAKLGRPNGGAINDALKRWNAV